MAKKLTEKELVVCWLNNMSAWADACDTVEEFEDTLKHLRKHRDKCKRLIKRSREHYKEVMGEYPQICRRDAKFWTDPFATGGKN